MAPNNPPPTGTVTFLFTDIEGSTALYENYPSRMQSARKRHDEILRSSIESHQGYVFKTVGDAFCAAFPTAREAVQATLAAQRTLFAEQWPENVTLRARMGLHTGVAEESEGDYFGPPVNRVARLMSTGHGGQVLLSDATHNLGRDDLRHLEPEAEMRYLGEHRLKDLRHTERIFQLIVPDLPKNFPPLKTDGLVAELVNLDRRYSRKGFLGGGGFADVYLVRHEALDREMALKVPKQQYAEDEQFVKRFEREARSAAKLSHPNIVAVHDAGEGLFEGRKTPYITMEHVPGGTLRDLIRQQNGPLTPSVAVGLALQVAEALGEAHRSGIIHRDIKPENILLSERGYAKVADFGIARAVSAATVAVSSALIATPHYISPEQAEGEAASFRSDLYSLGVVLYEMLTGEVPYDAETPWGILSKHVRGRLRPPKATNPSVPERINAITARLLARDPEERYPDAAALIADLERVRDDPGAVVDDTGPTVPGLGRARDDLDAIEDDARLTTTVRVPDLAGQKLARARGVLAKAGLSLGSQSRATSETVPEGEVVEQDPPAGTEVETHSPVSVTLSSGSSTVEVPYLAGLDRSEASNTLAEAGLKLGDQNEAPDDDAPEGEIVGQEPEAGTKAKRGSSVSITVSSGPRKVAVPDLTGRTLPRATEALAEAGLKLRTRGKAPSETVAEGAIIEQNPVAGTRLRRGNAVRVTVSTGPPTVEVPDLAGLDRSQASSTLTAAGLKLGTQNEATSETIPEGGIIGQIPEAGTKAEPDSSVSVTLSSGPSTVKVPDITGQEFEPLRPHGIVTPEEIINLDRRYRRIRYVGGGGFSDVYLVRHETLDRDMALKVLKNPYTEDEQFIERFKRGVKSAAKLSHPNIVAVYDVGEGIFEGQKVSYMAMEYMPGGNLNDLIRQQGGPLSPRTALELTLQVARALQAAHLSGIVHMGIKPQNILLTESREAKVAESGILMSLSSDAPDGYIIGTLHYISPEQAKGEPATFRSDLYSLGVVLYEMLTGKVPHDAKTPLGILNKHLHERPRPPREENPNVPERVEAVVMRLLAKDPTERHEDAAALVADLERVRDDLGMYDH